MIKEFDRINRIKIYLSIYMNLSDFDGNRPKKRDKKTPSHTFIQNDDDDDEKKL